MKVKLNSFEKIIRKINMVPHQNEGNPRVWGQMLGSHKPEKKQSKLSLEVSKDLHHLKNNQKSIQKS